SCVVFFSSRRRHTRSKRDWSSDVCSSDLENGFSRVYKFDINERSLTKLELPFEGVIHSFKKNKSHLYFLYSGMAEPHHFYRYDLIKGSLEKLFGNQPVNTEVSLSADTYISFNDMNIPYYTYEEPVGIVTTV